MCVRTKNSDPAHPHFWQKCLPNEEQIENPQNIKYFSKKNIAVSTKRLPPMQITQWSNKCCFGLMR